MKAMVLERFGGPEVFTLADLPEPEPGPGEVLVEVRASSVNPVDYKIRDGRAGFLVERLPAVLHPDCAGVVAAVGEGVRNLGPGERVYAFANGLGGKPGALAERMTVDARMVAPMPSGLDFEEAAALPLVSVTAWFALVHAASVKAGDTVLVMGGTGGVGHVAVQLAKARGATVAAACGSEDKMRIAADLGADIVFNYRDTDPADLAGLAPGGQGFDIVFNTPGEPAIDAAVAACRFEGTILDILGEFPTRPGFQMKWLSFKSIFAGRHIVTGADPARNGEIMRAFTDLVEDGSVRPLVDERRFGFRDVGAAHHYAEHGSPTGKVVLRQDLAG